MEQFKERERSAWLDKRRVMREAVSNGQATEAEHWALEAAWHDWETQRLQDEKNEAYRAEIEAARLAREKARVQRRRAASAILLPKEAQHLGVAAKAVYNALSKKMHERGKAIVAIAMLEAATGYKRSQVKRALDELVEARLILKTIRKDGRLNLPSLFRFATAQLLEFARRFFWRGRSIKEPQSRQVFKPVSTVAQKTTDEVQEQSQRTSRLAAGIKKVRAAGAEADTETYDRLAKIALEELGSPISASAAGWQITKAVDRLMGERISHFRDGEMDRFRKWHGRKADLAALETMMLTDVRERKISGDRPRNQRAQIKDPARYLAGILTKPSEKCRPHITLGRWLETRKRTLPLELSCEIAAFSARKAELRDDFDGV